MPTHMSGHPSHSLALPPPPPPNHPTTIISPHSLPLLPLQLKRAIPKHCFERSLLRSSYHLARNLATVGLLFLASSFIDHPALPKALSAALWPVYWAVQGAFLTGIWVIAHECGHGAFSDSTSINDAVGLVLHSLLLVPYFSW